MKDSSTRIAFSVGAALLLGAFCGSCNRAPAEAAPVKKSPTKRSRPRTPLDVKSQMSRRKATTAEKNATKSVALQHLRAFRNNDFRTATTLLTTKFREQLGGEARLRQIITRDHPEFAQVVRVRWVGAEAFGSGDDSRVMLRLRFLTREGHIVESSYGLMREDNRWRIGSISDSPVNFQRMGSGPIAENGALEQFFHETRR